MGLSCEYLKITKYDAVNHEGYFKKMFGTTRPKVGRLGPPSFKFGGGHGPPGPLPFLLHCAVQPCTPERVAVGHLAPLPGAQGTGGQGGRIQV